ncbi:acyl-CoA dehydrogenase family protein [Hyalangium versicolor]|uniref:acyl-CoA dehydrogenase family protein n=1 Tax=Hyalangium versicolor TaxID=2861190 RepID=UPI001CCB7C74|nr:acyl-CoA dehydrogenase family protein [Hyalangium versicolor]
MIVQATDVPSTTAPAPGFLQSLSQGVFRWDLIYPYPAQPEQDRIKGDAFAIEFEAFLKEHLDPAEIDRTWKLPADLIPLLREAGYLKLQLSPEGFGGLGLSNANLQRAIELAGSWCSPVALMLIIQNAAGAAAFLDYIQDVPTRLKYAQRVKDGAMGSIATTEPQGASNFIYKTTATLSEDGKSYIIDGEKLYISNGQVAELFAVSASIIVPGNPLPQGTLFMVERTMPGFSIASNLDFMGNHGLYNAYLRLDQVRVPVENMIGGIGQVGTIAGNVLLKARLYFAPTMALADSKLAMQWARDFVRLKVIDNQPLAHYQATQIVMGQLAANTYAVESMLDWIVLHMDMNAQPGAVQVDVSMEQNAAKNFGAEAGWRNLDMTYQLMAGVGYETAQSKEARDFPPFPLERIYRDARVQRIFGGTTEFVNITQGKLIFLPYFQPTGAPPAAPDAAPKPPGVGGLSARNQEHLAYVAQEVHHFGKVSAELLQKYPDVIQFFSQEAMLEVAGQLTTELFAMSACLSRAATLGEAQDGTLQTLTDVYCTAARDRVRELFRALSSRVPPSYKALSDSFMDSTRLDWLLEGVIHEMPPA